MLKIFVGWDAREDVAYQVCKKSIYDRSSIEVEVIPLIQSELRTEGCYKRLPDEKAATDFTFTRFFVPYLMNYSGKAVFCDCDFLWDCDAKEILDLFDPQYAVQVVKHNYVPTESIKMDNKVQYQYPKKNWSSMILWNCEHPDNMKLTPEFLNQAAGSTLHQFKWLKEVDVGEISHIYNWLEGWYKEPKDGTPKVVHYTRGGPWFLEYQDVDYAELWLQELKKL